MSESNELIMVMPSYAFKKAVEQIEDPVQMHEEVRNMYYAYMNTPGSVAMIERGKAEKDTSLLQPIPYAVIYQLDIDNVKEFTFDELAKNIYVLCYRRGSEGGESRLHNAVSIGFGGHINFEDVHEAMLDWPDSNPFTHCVQRELLEELNIKCGIAPDNALFTGTVFYDPSSEVSSLHICEAVFFCVNYKDGIEANESCIKQLEWLSLQDLMTGNQEDMESWTKNIIVYMRNALGHADYSMFNEAKQSEQEVDPTAP